MPVVCFAARGCNRAWRLFSYSGAARSRLARARRVYAVFMASFALFGLGVAGWHTRLQNLPADEVPSCGPGLDYMLENFPLGEALGMVFKGSGECADVVWSFLGLSMPSWVFISLLVVGGAGLWNNFRQAS